MRGATQLLLKHRHRPDVSIHAPHAGRDLVYLYEMGVMPTFQSTRPMRGATETSKPSSM